jgi:hypothetical protein
VNGGTFLYVSFVFKKHRTQVSNLEIQWFESRSIHESPQGMPAQLGVYSGAYQVYDGPEKEMGSVEF